MIEFATRAEMPQVASAQVSRGRTREQAARAEMPQVASAQASRGRTRERMGTGMVNRLSKWRKGLWKFMSRKSLSVQSQDAM
jgi:hypothetical protein